MKAVARPAHTVVGFDPRNPGRRSTANEWVSFDARHLSTMPRFAISARIRPSVGGFVSYRSSKPTSWLRFAALSWQLPETDAFGTSGPW